MFEHKPKREAEPKNKGVFQNCCPNYLMFPPPLPEFVDNEMN